MHRKRNAQNRDLKVIITSRDSQTGTEDDARALARVHFDQYGFDAEKVTVHPGEFKQLYNEKRAGEVIIMDEAEQLDSRRSMSNKNVEFWNLWQTMRFRQITSILTLPTRSRSTSVAWSSRTSGSRSPPAGMPACTRSSSMTIRGR
jgi:hypothetical protein